MKKKRSRKHKSLTTKHILPIIIASALAIPLLIISAAFIDKNLNLDIRNQASGSYEPYGYIDIFDKTTIAGWAKDDDAGDNQVILHVYVDNMFYDFIVSDKDRTDVGKHAFYYTHKPFGPGEHKVDVYIIGINESGNPDGVNGLLLHNGKAPSDCGDFPETDFVQEWCKNNVGYWQNKYKDTTYLVNNNMKLGINNSYGGTVFELYGNDRTKNLIQEHGGSAVQLSLYGYDISRGATEAWFSAGKCSSAYATSESCKQANGGTCVIRGAQEGSQVANCTTVKTCNGQDAGFPYNPIQAQGADCAWETSTNDVYNSYSNDSGSDWNLNYNGFSNFSKSTAFPGLVLEQSSKLHNNYAEMNYTIKYDGSLNLSEHGQEIPAIFTSSEINYWFYSIDSDGKTNKDHIASGSEKRVQLSKDIRNRYWGVCNKDETHCLTVYMPNQIARELYLKSLKDTAGGDHGGAYITPIGYFAIEPWHATNIHVIYDP